MWRRSLELQLLRVHLVVRPSFIKEYARIRCRQSSLRYSSICDRKDGWSRRKERLGLVSSSPHSTFISRVNLAFHRIFILEGLLTIVVSLGAFFVVPTWAHKAKFVSPAVYNLKAPVVPADGSLGSTSQLSATERSRLLSRLAADSDAAAQETFAWKYVRQALTDPLVWGYALLFHGYAFALYSLSLFLVGTVCSSFVSLMLRNSLEFQPTIIAGLGFTSWQAQL